MRCTATAADFLTETTLFPRRERRQASAAGATACRAASPSLLPSSARTRAAALRTAWFGLPAASAQRYYATSTARCSTSAILLTPTPCIPLHSAFAAELTPAAEKYRLSMSGGSAISSTSFKGWVARWPRIWAEPRCVAPNAARIKEPQASTAANRTSDQLSFIPCATASAMIPHPVRASCGASTLAREGAEPPPSCFCTWSSETTGASRSCHVPHSNTRVAPLDPGASRGGLIEAPAGALVCGAGFAPSGGLPRKIGIWSLSLPAPVPIGGCNRASAAASLAADARTNRFWCLLPRVKIACAEPRPGVCHKGSNTSNREDGADTSLVETLR